MDHLFRVRLSIKICDIYLTQIKATDMEYELKVRTKIHVFLLGKKLLLLEKIICHTKHVLELD